MASDVISRHEAPAAEIGVVLGKRGYLRNVAVSDISGSSLYQRSLDFLANPNRGELGRCINQPAGQGWHILVEATTAIVTRPAYCVTRSFCHNSLLTHSCGYKADPGQSEELEQTNPF